jgi:hypothetical protein
MEGFVMKKLRKIEEIISEYRNGYEILESPEMLEEIKRRLITIPDRRHQTYIKHNLIDIVMIALFATLAEANEWLDMEIFVKKREKWFRGFLELLKKITMGILKMAQGWYKLSLNKMRYTLALDFENEINKILSLLDVKNIQKL